MVYARHLKCRLRNEMRVRFPLPAPISLDSREFSARLAQNYEFAKIYLGER